MKIKEIQGKRTLELEVSSLDVEAYFPHEQNSLDMTINNCVLHVGSELSFFCETQDALAAYSSR